VVTGGLVDVREELEVRKDEGLAFEEGACTFAFGLVGSDALVTFAFSFVGGSASRNCACDFSPEVRSVPALLGVLALPHIMSVICVKKPY